MSRMVMTEMARRKVREGVVPIGGSKKGTEKEEERGGVEGGYPPSFPLREERRRDPLPKSPVRSSSCSSSSPSSSSSEGRLPPGLGGTYEGPGRETS